MARNWHLLASKLIDRKAPEKSLLLLKPVGRVTHEGGKKILPGDQGYKAFRSWLEDYTKIVGDQYAKTDDLPKTQAEPDRFASDIWLKLPNTPAPWGDRLPQVDVYAWDAQKKAWEASPIGTSDRQVSGQGRLWQHNLTLLTAKGSARAKEWKGKPSLPSGKYLVRVYVDSAGRLAKDWKVELGDRSLPDRWR